jgi:hypothetical protein
MKQEAHDLKWAKPAFEYNQYIEGKKYCRRCEVFPFYNGGLFSLLRNADEEKSNREKRQRAA